MVSGCAEYKRLVLRKSRGASVLKARMRASTLSSNLTTQQNTMSCAGENAGSVEGKLLLLGGS